MGVFCFYFDKIAPPLTEDQKKNPYAKFYFDPVEDPDTKVLEHLQEDQMDPANALVYDTLIKAILLFTTLMNLTEWVYSFQN